MIQPADLIPNVRNPRVFSEKADRALKKSMGEFNDISGITWNKTTANIVGGHHRWDNLVHDYGIDNLKFKQVAGTDRHLINYNKEFTGYILRVVEWTVDKELAANVTANSHTVEGTFTAELQDILEDIKDDLEDGLYDALGFDELEVNLTPLPDEDDDEPEDKPVKKSETLISGGGEKYITIKLELSPRLATRFHEVLDRFNPNNEKFETPLKTILTFLEKTPDSDIVKPKTKRKRKAK